MSTSNQASNPSSPEETAHPESMSPDTVKLSEEKVDEQAKVLGEMQRAGKPLEDAVAYLVKDGLSEDQATAIAQTSYMINEAAVQQLTEADVKTLVFKATNMAVEGKSIGTIKKMLVDAGLREADASMLANRVHLDASAARERFNASKSSASNGAYWRIAGGIFIGIVCLIFMASGADTGRRSPVGGLIAAGFMVASGIKMLGEVEGQTFESRYREVQRQGR